MATLARLTPARRAGYHQGALKTAAVKRRKKRDAAAAARTERKRAKRGNRCGPNWWRPGLRVHERMLLAMVPGEAYGRLDLARGAGGPERNNRGTVTLRLLKRGLVIRTKNPAYRAGLQRHFGEPVWLYTLTASGEGAAERLRAHGGGA